jgi:formate dehydrogenase major subunit
VGSCDIRPGRRPQGEDLLRLVAEYQSRSGTTVYTDNERITDPAHEIVEPPVDQDDPRNEGWSRW